MSTLEKLVTQWLGLCEAAAQLDAAAARLEHDRTDMTSVATELRIVESAINKATERLDSLIAEAVPTHLQDAAILAAFAWRAHNENDLVVTATGELTDLRVFDDALSKVLTNLVRFLARASNSEMLALMRAWCIPLGDGGSRR